MSSNKDLFISKMNALNDSINTKAGVTGKHTIDEMKTNVDGIQVGTAGSLKNYLDLSQTCQNAFSNKKNLTFSQLEDVIGENDTANVTSMSSMFQGCSSLTSVPLFNTSNVTNVDNMFLLCVKLTSVPAFDLRKANSIGAMVGNCYSLTSFLCYGMKASFNIQSCTLLQREELVTILNNLAEVTSTRKLTMGATLLDRLTNDDKSIALNKGWTLA